MKEPTNTTEQVKRNPGSFLAETLIFGSSNTVERMEQLGQRELAESDTLPTEMTAEDRSVLQMLGVVFGSEVNGDPLFQYATLPAGWTKKPTSHPMWSDLLDDKGRIRGGIFYKAAAYDRSAHLHLCTRYYVISDYSEGDKLTYVAKDGEETLFTASAEKRPDDSSWFMKQAEVRAKAENWLSVRYPNWRKPGCYWD